MARQVIESGRLTSEIWYMAAGRGRQLIYLPPFGLHNKPLIGWQQRASLRAVSGLTRHFRVYWINRKENLSVGATVHDLARDTSEAIQAKFSKPVDILGYSLGGMVGIALAANHRTLVHRLVIGGIAYRLTERERDGCVAFVQHAEAGNLRAGTAALARSSFRSPIAKAVLGGLAWLTAPAAAGKDYDPQDAVVMLRAIINANLEPLLPSIQVPTLVIAGERDFNCPPGYVRNMVSSIPNAYSDTIRNKGHGGAMTAHEFVDKVRRFVLGN